MKRWKLKGIWALVGLAISGAVMLLQKSQLDGTLGSWLKITSNGLLSGGVILALIGFFILAVQGGAFDGIAFAAKKLSKHRPGDSREDISFYEYTTRGRTKRPIPAMLLPGLIYFVIAIVLSFLYYKV